MTAYTWGMLKPFFFFSVLPIVVIPPHCVCPGPHTLSPGAGCHWPACLVSQPTAELTRMAVPSAKALSSSTMLGLCRG
jgi:hypothetical protein